MDRNYVIIKSPYIPVNSLQVILAGAGGVGSRLVPPLVKMLPSGTILDIYDPDIVEKKNLNRQHFCHRDLGKPKAQVLAERYSNDRVSIRAFFRSVGPEDEDALGAYQKLFIGCVDTYEGRMALVNLTARQYYSRLMAYIDVGNSRLRGQVLLVHLNGHI